MKIQIDWKTINTEEEFYDVFLPQVSAPDWHGRNLNALGDSIVTGDVNGIEPPYTIVNKNINCCASSTLKEFQLKVLEIFSEAKQKDREITIVNQ